MAQTDCVERVADASVDDAVHAYEEADFERANALFDQLILGADLSRSDLVRVYATRALLRFGDGDGEGMLHDLTALASLEPSYDLGPRAPPPVHAAFDRVRGEALDVAISVEPTPLGVHVVARATADRAAITRAVVVGVRTRGGSFRESTDGSVTLTQPGDEIEYYARVVGPGGATLVERGSREQPQVERVVPFEAHDDTLAIALGATGGALAVAAIVVTIVVLTLVPTGSDQVIGPTFQIPSM